MPYDIHVEMKSGYLFVRVTGRMISNLREATRWIGRQVEYSDSQNKFTGNADGKPHFGA